MPQLWMNQGGGEAKISKQPFGDGSIFRLILQLVVPINQEFKRSGLSDVAPCNLNAFLACNMH